MTEDESLDALGALERQQQADEDPVWELLAEGKLDPDALAELERRAATDPDVAERLQLFRPFDDEVQARFADAIAPPATPPASIAKARRRPRIAMTLIPLGLAAALAIFLMRPQYLAPLPGYAAVVSGGQSEMRSPDSTEGPTRLSSDSELEVVLRPAVAVEGEVRVQWYVLSQDGVAEVSVKTERATSGALRMRERASTLFGDRRGEVALVALIGRPEAFRGDLSTEVRGRVGSPVMQRVQISVALTEK